MALGMHKPDQGYWTRTCSAIAGLALTASAIVWSSGQLSRFDFSPQTANVVGWSVGLGFAALGLILVYLLVYQKPTPSEFLIATEGEMKKVNWSSRREVLGSTWVVIFVAISIAVILLIVDTAFSSFFRAINILKVG